MEQNSSLCKEWLYVDFSSYLACVLFYERLHVRVLLSSLENV